MKRCGIILILAVFLGGCNNKVVVEENPLPIVSKEINYGEQMPQIEALAAISFKPKRLSGDKSPFSIRKETAILNKTNKPSEIIELGYGGHGHSITLIVENETELNKDIALEWDNSLKYEEILLENGENALYGEGEHSHHILWAENGLSYFMALRYKGGVSPAPERYSKLEVIGIVNNLE